MMHKVIAVKIRKINFFILKPNSCRIVTELHPEPARKLSTNLYDIYQCKVYSE